MPTDSGFLPDRETLKDRMTAKMAMGRLQGSLPGFAWAEPHMHWALRLPLMGIMLQYGVQKFPAAFVAPGEQGVPAVLFILAAFAEILAPIALFMGGVVESWRPKDGMLRLGGDVLTRAGALAGVATISGVIAWFFWPIVTVEVHVVLLGLTLFLFLRGNR